jgi:hypothetical protein
MQNDGFHCYEPVLVENDLVEDYPVRRLQLRVKVLSQIGRVGTRDLRADYSTTVNPQPEWRARVEIVLMNIGLPVVDNADGQNP